MSVFIANFGLENYEWPQCLARGTIATMNDVRVQGFWEVGDREAYIEYCLRNMKTTIGETPIRPVASRWFNLMSIIVETSGDLWIHRAKDQFWWTISSPAPAIFEQRTEPVGTKRDVIVCHKPCQQWSDRTRKGAPLNWNGIHPRAREFLFTEGTLQQLTEDNALYAEALIGGEDLGSWHSRLTWKAKEQKSGRTPVTYFDARKKAVWRMAETALQTAKGTNGQQVLRTVKNKEFRFPSKEELMAYIVALMDAQDNTCAITSLPLQFGGDGDDDEMLASLDRIDSDGHYERGNLQIICRFVNRWKSDSDDQSFRQLIGAVRSTVQ